MNNQLNRVSANRSGSSSRLKNEDYDYTSENIFQMNTKNKPDATQVVEELKILWSRKQTVSIILYLVKFCMASPC